MLKIAIGTIFYNNKPELQRLADSIPSKTVNYWIAIDGPFKYNLEVNPDLSHHSDDGSIEVITESRNKFNNGVILHYKPGATEFEKRNIYLQNCQKLKKDIDVLLIVDSDEYFVYPPSVPGGPELEPLECWNRFKKNLEIEMIQNPHHNVYGIPYFEDRPGGWKATIGTAADTYKPRIFVNPGKMRYISNSHYNYANIETELETVEYFKTFRQVYCQHAAKIIRGGVALTQDQSLRTKEYQEQRKKYQQYLVALEPLVQQGKPQEEADKIAKDKPAENWNPN